jgi:tRNA (adenine37-N6)-methyltransferase
MTNKITYKPIGIIHTPFTTLESTPIQGCFVPNSRGTIEIYTEYVRGLTDLEGFSHLILLYHFHKTKGYSLMAKPFLDKDKRGIFACRYFKRPNCIGLSIVRLYGVKGNLLDIGEVDMLDDTPLIDIKPYVPQFDQKDNAETGWYERATERSKYEVDND